MGCHTDNFFEQKVEILSPKNFPHIDLAMKHLLSLENFQETQEDYTRIDLENIFNCNKFERAIFVSFQLKSQFCLFIGFCSSLGPAAQIFTKLLKISISLIRKLNVTQ